MTRSKLQTVLKLLPDLKPVELQEVKDRVEVLSVPSPWTKDTWANDWLLDGIAFELRRRGLLSDKFTLTSRFRFSSFPKGFMQTSSSVKQHLLAAVDIERPLTPTEKTILGQKVARALADYLTWRRGFGLHVMLEQIGAVPEAVDASYPGWMAGRKLGLLVRAKEVEE